MASILPGLILLALCGLVLAQKPKPPVLDIPGLGQGQGDYGTSRGGRQFERYRGIRFGKAPSTTGRRFLPAFDEEPWTDSPRDLTKFGRACTQVSPIPIKNDWYTFHQLRDWEEPEAYSADAADSEDCLMLHVYTPNREGNFPVMVWFHGGAFLDGSAHIYGPRFFMDHDVVIVVPHYRLGPLGFLSMETDEIPGNAGMYDQVQALKWVQAHIGSFGGDNSKVTIFGESAGGASVSFLAISPIAQGLFHRVIAESGASLDEWSIDATPKRSALGIAKFAGCAPEENTPEADIIECLKTVDAMTLTEAYKNDWKPLEISQGRTGFSGCTPIIQKHGVDPSFMPQHPLDVWADPTFEPVPAIYGTNKHEGTYVMAIMYSAFLVANNLTENTEFLKYDCMAVFLNLFGIKDNSYFVADSVENEYIGAENMGNLTKMIPGLTDFTGVAFLKGASYENLKLHALRAKNGKSYWYTFNYDGTSVTLWPFISHDICSPFPGGVCHANELLMIWNIPLFGYFQNYEEEMLSKQMTKMWYNFAAHGEPNPEANPVKGVPPIPAWDEENKHYIRLVYPIEVPQDFTKEYNIALEENFADGFENRFPSCREYEPV